MSVPERADRPEHPSGAPAGLVAAVVGLLLLAALAALTLGPGRGLRTDIAAQRSLLGRQLTTTKAQLEVTRAQLAVAEQQRHLAEDQLNVTRSQLDVAHEQLDTARTQLARTEESLAVQRRLLATAEETLRHVQRIDEKTPDASPVPLADR